MNVICPNCQNPIALSGALPAEMVCPSCGSTFPIEGGSTGGWVPGAGGRRLGRFELIDIVGAGAFGTVYLARDPELDRVVAVKVPRSGNLAAGEHLDRFLREARAAAQLRHPSIVSVHEVGQDNGLPYLVSDFVRGASLADLLTGRRLSFQESARLAAAVADALGYAHDHGVVHRDVKPSNIMIGEDGAPRVMDFGLARRDAGEATMTVEGQVLGTPAYMSPEQARGEAHRVDGRSDVYSLGVILYQLLTGEVPFRGNMRMLLHQVLNDEPRPPRSLNDAVPRDLETVCLKAMAKEPSRRYQGARELADDLRRFLEGKPVVARPVGRVERGWRWCRRNPAVAGLMAAVVLALTLGAGVASVFAVKAHREAARATEKEEDAIRKAADEARQRERAEGLLYASQIGLALREWQGGKIVVAQDILDATDRNRRGWEYHYLDTLFNHLGQRTFLGHISTVWSVSFSPDGRRIVSGGEDSTVKVWDAQTGQEALSLKGHTGPVYSVCFSPDGKRLASGGGEFNKPGEVKVWDAHTGQEQLSLKGHTHIVNSVCFSPDGKRIASGSQNLFNKILGEVKVWDAQTGQEQLSLKGHTNGVESVAFSPDGKRIASGSGDKTMKVWDAQTGQEVLSLKGHTGPVRSVAFSPDGKRLASGSGNRNRNQPGEVKVWEAQTGQELLSLKGHTDIVSSVCFSPDGKRIVSGSGDIIGDKPGEVKVWDAQTGQEQLSLKGHTLGVRSVAISPDGKRIVSGSRDSTVKVWDAQIGQEALSLKGHTGRVTGVCFSADGKRIVSGGGEPFIGEVKVWDAQTGQDQLSLKGRTGYVLSVAFSPDGKRIVSGSDAKTVKVWDAQTGQETLSLKGHTGPVRSVAFSPDGKRIASGSLDQTVKVWDAQTGQEQLSLKGHTGWVTSVCFSPDGKRIVSGSNDETVKVWDAQTGQEQLSLKGHTLHVFSVCFSPDGKRLASGDGQFNKPGEVKVWDAQTGQEQLSLKGHTDAVNSVAFSPDGKRIASGSGDRTVKVWDAHTGQELISLKGHTNWVTSVAFSPDGKRIVSGSGDQTVKVWEAQTGQEAFSLKGHTGLVISVAFSPDGKRLISTDASGKRRVWDLATGKLLPGAIEPIAIPGPRSSDGKFFAHVQGSVIRLHRLRPPTAEELAEARRWVDPDFAWHAAEARSSEAAGQWFAAAFHLGRLLPSRPWEAALHVRRAYALSRLGRTTEATAHYLQAVLLDPRVRLWPLDPAAAARGQKAAFAGDWPRAVADLELTAHQPGAPLAAWSSLLLARRAVALKDAQLSCREILDHFESNAGLSWHVLDCCRITPCAEADARRLVKVAERLVAARRNADSLSFLGGALYRAGRLEEAARTLQESINVHGKGGYVDAWLFLAMTQHRLGQGAEARRLLTRFEGWHKGQKFATWQSTTHWRLLHDEARRLILAMPRATE